jgi:4-alpha-glucanotransferase
MHHIDRRSSGILLHITSLPSAFGIGDLGPEAYRFADFLAETRQRFWQILPLNPTDPEHGNSPYHSMSAFAGHPLLLSPEGLLQEGLLVEKEVNAAPPFPDGFVDFKNVLPYKKNLFQAVCSRFRERKRNPEYEAFLKQNAQWLDDFALFEALKSHFNGRVWVDWPEAVRDREPGTLEALKRQFSNRIDRFCILQYLFQDQWMSLKRYCNERDITIIGDIPYYVDFDSADVWARPEIFNLDENKRPKTVAGVPPDYFSETGQLWGNPVYRWDILKERGYAWWLRRITHNLERYDMVRIDHFRGFVGYWEVPAGEENAVTGQWIGAPAEDFFGTIEKEIPHAPIIAEDLGTITPDVKEIMSRFGFPGMKVLLFAFGEDLPRNPYAPHNIEENAVVYTGTHDNNTARAWFEKEAGPEVRERLLRYIGRRVSADEIHWELVRLAMMSAASLAIFPMQDLLGLNEGARMNRPATREGNWEWRLEAHLLNVELMQRLSEMTELYGRA